MKTPAATPEKKAKEARVPYTQANFSQAALNLMEQATGQRLTRLPPSPKPPAAAASD